MEQEEPLLLEPLLTEAAPRRRSLLPEWMKVFLWIFLVMGVIAPIGLLTGRSGARVQLALYGLATNDPTSLTGLLITALFVLKAVVAYGLWTEKSWGVNLGLVDAVVGIGVCAYLMVVAPFLPEHRGFVFTFRLELLLLIPYLVRLWKIGPRWKQA